jgi:hypothetical protein
MSDHKKAGAGTAMVKAGMSAIGMYVPGIGVAVAISDFGKAAATFLGKPTWRRSTPRR